MTTAMTTATTTAMTTAVTKMTITTHVAPCPDFPQKIAPSTLVRWLKFNLVGGMGIVVQFAALFLLKSVLHLHYLAATAIAVEAAVVHNFIWHEQFTWADRTNSDRAASWRRSLPRLLRFNLTNGAVSILGNLALMKVMVGLGHLNYLIANAIAIALCSLANFLVSETWVFESSRSQTNSVIAERSRAGCFVILSASFARRTSATRRWHRCRRHIALILRPAKKRGPQDDKVMGATWGK